MIYLLTLVALISMSTHPFISSVKFTFSSLSICHVIVLFVAHFWKFKSDKLLLNYGNPSYQSQTIVQSIAAQEAHIPMRSNNDNNIINNNKNKNPNLKFS